MKMIAKVILEPKPNSFQFDDRILLLEEPAKVGKSVREGLPGKVYGGIQADQGIRYCTVESQQGVEPVERG